MATVYNYTHDTYEYTGQSECAHDPYSDEPMPPANSTMVEVIETGDNEVAIFNEDTQEWNVVCDFRGTKYFIPESPDAFTIESLGVEIPDDALEHIHDVWVASNVRVERNDRLMKCDWIVLTAFESNGSVSDDWKTYRQALRDISEQETFPHDIDWPVSPEDSE